MIFNKLTVIVNRILYKIFPFQFSQGCYLVFVDYGSYCRYCT